MYNGFFNSFVAWKKTNNFQHFCIPRKQIIFNTFFFVGIPIFFTLLSVLTKKDHSSLRVSPPLGPVCRYIQTSILVKNQLHAMEIPNTLTIRYKN